MFVFRPASASPAMTPRMMPQVMTPPVIMLPVKMPPEMMPPVMMSPKMIPAMVKKDEAMPVTILQSISPDLLPSPAYITQQEGVTMVEFDRYPV